MANESANPNLVNQIATTTDTSVVNSLTGGGASYFGSAVPVVTSNSHPIAIRGDQALWDVTSGAYVSIQNTSAGTTTCPKNGQ
jgi:hypothetical protein